MTTLFDRAESKRLCAVGKAQAESPRTALVAEAKQIAETYARAHGSVSIENVHAEMERRGHDPSELGCASGVVFSRPKWKPIGWEASTRVKSRSRAVRIWTLVEQ